MWVGECVICDVGFDDLKLYEERYDDKTGTV